MINWFSTNSTKAIQWRTNNLFNKWCWNYWMATCNIIKLDCYSHHVSYTNINLMWIIGQYVWATYKITCANIIQRWYTTQFKNRQKNWRRRILQRRYLDNKHLRKCSTSFVIREIQMKTTCSLEELECKDWPNQVLARMGSVVALGWRDHKSAWGNVGELWVCHMTQQSLTFLQLTDIWVVASLGLWQVQRCTTQIPPHGRICCPVPGSVPCPFPE